MANVKQCDRCKSVFPADKQMARVKVIVNEKAISDIECCESCLPAVERAVRMRVTLEEKQKRGKSKESV